MITLVDEPDVPNGFVIPEGLSVPEALSLRCEFWTPHSGDPFDPGEIKARGCQSTGHYLCEDCASFDLEWRSVLDRQYDHDDVVPMGWEP